MKKLLLTLTSILFCAITFAQSVPQGINYQAVARDANGDVLINQALTIQFSVISDITTSAISWQETHQDTTNDYGLYTVIIGQGISTGVGILLAFDIIDWRASHHFLKVEIDFGNGFVDMGTTAFMSVPYSLHSRTADGVTGIVVGLTGQSTGYGVYGENFDNIAPLGNGIGVSGKGYYGVFGEDRYQGSQPGAYGVYSNGALGATGTKAFRIDHPKDPENKFLRHFSIESDEVLNLYRGTTIFDVNGEAIIELPDYFNNINRNVSYQLTPVGAYMPLFIKEKANGNNQFVVGGGISGKEVSWSVYAERNDLYLQKNPQQRMAELEKRPQEKGKYLIPELYDSGPEKRIVIE